MQEAYLERLNNPLIIDRVHKLDILGVTITHKPDWGYFRVSVETMIGSGAWIFIPPIMQLITPTNDECVRFFELFVCDIPFVVHANQYRINAKIQVINTLFRNFGIV